MRNLNEVKQLTWADLLPRGSAKKIHEEIGKIVSLRMVQSIISEKSIDKHGVIKIAMRLIEEHNKMVKSQESAKKKLHFKKSQPLKSK